MSRWQVVEFVLAPALEDPAAALLRDLGSVGWETREAGEGRVRLLAYWPAPAPAGLRSAVMERLAELALRQGEPAPDVSSAQEVPEEDWEAGWRRHFRLERPLPDLVVHPSWISYAALPGETVI
ncbi:MAG: hypothetical protein Q8R92_14965, partial [Deltaproteobacteria bacterium]|nr:hypothetical protein [Deltaproteobacteria bacterium]